MIDPISDSNINSKADVRKIIEIAIRKDSKSTLIPQITFSLYNKNNMHTEEDK